LTDLLGPTGGLNGTTFLNATTVQDDGGAVDVLVGGLGLAWFLTSTGDKVNDFNKGGAETRTVV